MASHHIALKTGNDKAEDGRYLEALPKKIQRFRMGLQIHNVKIKRKKTNHPYDIELVRLCVLGNDRRRLQMRRERRIFD